MNFAQCLVLLLVSPCFVCFASACGSSVDPARSGEHEGGIVDDVACPAAPDFGSPCSHPGQVCEQPASCVACEGGRYTAIPDQRYCFGGQWSYIDRRRDCSGATTPLYSDSACTRRATDVTEASATTDATAPPPDATAGACGPGLACTGGDCSGPTVCQQCRGQLWIRASSQFICQDGRLEAIHVDCAAPGPDTFSDPACTHPSVQPDAG